MVRAVIEKVCELTGFDDKTAGRIMLSVDEALTNVIRHAYDGADDKPIEVEVTTVKDSPASSLRICLRDYGRVADPATIKSRDLANVRPGGLGVHIMTASMDQVTYTPAEGGGTLLTMVKKLPSKKKTRKT